MFRGVFQAKLLEHWHSIKQDQPFPLKRSFRPQNFPSFLGQFAFVTVEKDKTFTDTLTGSVIIEALQLSEDTQKLTDPADQTIKRTLHKMLVETATAAEPMFFTGKLTPQGLHPVNFSTLILPFSNTDPTEKLESLLLAFDFTKYTSSNFFALPK